jgi:hypothetical protein
LLIRHLPYQFREKGKLGKQNASFEVAAPVPWLATVQNRPAQGSSTGAKWSSQRMKSVSPWFQTAHLLNGIRKTVSEIEANRSVPADRNVRPADSAILQRVDEKKPN